MADPTGKLSSTETVSDSTVSDDKKTSHGATTESLKPATGVESAKPAAAEAEAAEVPKASPKLGPTGLDPTRYGDWVKNGRCIDF